MDNGASSYRRFLSGDDTALSEIVKEYADGLTLYLNGIVEDFGAAEDLMEDTFFRLITAKPKFDERYSFKTFLYTIGRNLAIDHIRRRKRLVKEPILDEKNFPQDAITLEQRYIRMEDRLAVHKAMKALHPEYRQVLWLMYFENLSAAEVGFIMKKSSRQMKNLVYRAKGALKALLDKEDFIYEEL